MNDSSAKINVDTSKDLFKPEAPDARPLLTPTIDPMRFMDKASKHNHALALALGSLGIYTQPIAFGDKAPLCIAGQYADDAPDFDRERQIDRWIAEKLKKSSLMPNVPPIVGSTRSAETIKAWVRYHTDPAVGIACGINRLAIIDCDRHAKGNTADGVRWFEEHHVELGFPEMLAGFPMVATPGGGLHIYCRLPDQLAGMNSVNGWRPGIDMKLGAGYVLAADTIVAKGRYCSVVGHPFVWSRSAGVPSSVLPELPAKILEELMPIKERREGKRRQLISRGYTDGVDAFHGALDRSLADPEIGAALQRSGSNSGRAWRGAREGEADRNRWALGYAMARDGFSFSEFVVAVEQWGALGSSRPGKPEEGRLRTVWGHALTAIEDASNFDVVDGEED